jgi:hypothetical protein
MKTANAPKDIDVQALVRMPIERSKIIKPKLRFSGSKNELSVK